MPSGSLRTIRHSFAWVFRFDQAVDDVDARFFQPVAQAMLFSLVEARLQLDQHRDLLAGFGGLDQQIDQRRIVADAVQRHLDRHDVGSRTAVLSKPLDRGERVERVMEQ